MHRHAQPPAQCEIPWPLTFVDQQSVCGGAGKAEESQAGAGQQAFNGWSGGNISHSSMDTNCLPAAGGQVWSELLQHANLHSTTLAVLHVASARYV